MNEIKDKIDSHLYNIPIKKFFLGVLSIAVLILIWGFFYGLAKVKFPKNKLPVFPVENYKSARDHFQSPNTFKLVGIKEIQRIIESELDLAKPSGSAVRSVIKSIEEELGNKNLVFKGVDQSMVNSNIQNKHQQIISKCQVKIDSLNTAIDSLSSYYDIRHAKSEKYDYEKIINNSKQLIAFAENLRIQPKVYFSVSKKYHSFNYVAGSGSFERVKNSDSEYEFKSDKLKAIINSKFFTNNNLPQEIINQKILDIDAKNFKNIVKTDKTNFEDYKKRIKQQLKKQTRDSRKDVRRSFYKKWYTKLVSAIISVLMFLVLYRYYTILRRKGITKKSTDKIYYATNKTSIVFRWIALGIVIIGLFHIGIDLLSIIFRNDSVGVLSSLLPDFGLVYSFIAPIATVVLTVLASWFFVLNSEFICFLTNCYHIVFIKAHGEVEE